MQENSYNPWQTKNFPKGKYMCLETAYHYSAACAAV